VGHDARRDERRGHDPCPASAAAEPHGLECLRPGLVRVSLRGPVDEAQAIAILDFGRQAAVGSPPAVRVLALVGDVGPVSAQARRAFRRGLETLPVAAVALVGLSAPARVAARVFFRALRVARLAPFEVRFFRAEPEAARWLA